jgi:hypothetical protein
MALVLQIFSKEVKALEYSRMSKKNLCVIEVNVPSGPEGWQEVVNSRMKQELDKLKIAVEELGGQVRVRY